MKKSLSAPVAKSEARAQSCSSKLISSYSCPPIDPKLVPDRLRLLIDRQIALLEASASRDDRSPEEIEGDFRQIALAARAWRDLAGICVAQDGSDDLSDDEDVLPLDPAMLRLALASEMQKLRDMK